MTSNPGVQANPSVILLAIGCNKTHMILFGCRFDCTDTCYIYLSSNVQIGTGIRLPTKLSLNAHVQHNRCRAICRFAASKHAHVGARHPAILHSLKGRSVYMPAYQHPRRHMSSLSPSGAAAAECSTVLPHRSANAFLSSPATVAQIKQRAHLNSALLCLTAPAQQQQPPSAQPQCTAFPDPCSSYTY